ncbi:MAG: 30S processome protein Utp24 [Thermoprotei archaeon]
METNWLWSAKGLRAKNMLILMDTSFILACVEKGKDLLAIVEKKSDHVFKPVVPHVVLDELRSIMSRGGKRGRLALLALEMANRYEKLSDKLMPNEDVDSFIIRIAFEKKLIVATNDVHLRSRLRKLGIPHIYLRYDGNVDYFGL